MAVIRRYYNECITFESYHARLIIARLILFATEM